MNIAGAGGLSKPVKKGVKNDPIFEPTCSKRGQKLGPKINDMQLKMAYFGVKTGSKSGPKMVKKGPKTSFLAKNGQILDPFFEPFFQAQAQNPQKVAKTGH